MRTRRPARKSNWHTKRTFIGLEVPAPMADLVSQLRREFGSWRVALPAEITLAGSSGLGVLRYHESEIAAIWDTLREIAQGFAPITTRFCSVGLFPGTKVFYFVPDNAAPLQELHAAIAQSGLRFERTPFPFTPHCTIADLENAALALPDELRALARPEIEITLHTLAVYRLDERVLGGNPNGCHLLGRTPLGAA